MEIIAEAMNKCFDALFKIDLIVWKLDDFIYLLDKLEGLK